MGNSISNLTSYNFFCKQLRIVLIGLDNAGKTTLFYQIMFKQEIPSPAPTTAFNAKTIQLLKNIKLDIWDTTGSSAFRPLWKAYVRKSDAIVFVIDSSDNVRFDEAKIELELIVNSKETKGIPVLIVANKQDLSFSVSPIDIAQKLQLDSLAESVNWHVYPISARHGTGVDDMLLKLAEIIAMNKVDLKRTKSGTIIESSSLTSFEKIQASEFV
ncbi:ADP-ribosylation factor-like protein 3 isoform X2 [Hydra vulgaris]|uniref:ADP-ribosylation factor-like protein 3 isoform X2 n=1 Tax=Hydra vulgaris TaxID=6087 RepID=A0ABM4CAH3_HYDVU